MEKNILLTIEYDGTGFSGWQRQPGRRTVQGVLEDLLTEIVYGGKRVTIDGTSRTDAGVHALGQRATFQADIKMPVENLMKVMNDRLSGRPESRSENEDIRIVGCEEVPDGFHARRSANGKMYRYSIRNAASMPVFFRDQRYLVTKPLDIERMREAAEYIKGTHDFACFQAAGGEPGKTTVRTVTKLDITAKEAEGGGTDIDIEIAGDGFLYNMVRIITGTLVEVGEGKTRPEELQEIIDSGNRENAGHTAPPQGLTLVEVYYR